MHANNSQAACSQKMFHFEEAEYFEAPESEMEVPEVKF